MSDCVQVCCLPADCCPPTSSCCPPSCDPCCPPSCDPCCPPKCTPGCPPSCDPCCPPSCDPCCPSSYVCCTSDGCCEVVCCPVKKCKSRELRASVLKADCDCVKKNGLQDECIRKECRGKPCCVTKPYPLCCPSTYYWRYANMTMGKRVTKREKIPKKGTCGIGENYGCNPCVKPVKNNGKTIRKTDPECPHKFPNCCDPLQSTEYTCTSSDPTSLSQYQTC